MNNFMNESHKLNRAKKRLIKLVKKVKDVGLDRRENINNRIKELEHFISANKNK